jgi:hypothetical protein
MEGPAGGVGGALASSLGGGFLEGLFLFDLHRTYTRHVFSLFSLLFPPLSQQFQEKPNCKKKDTSTQDPNITQPNTLKCGAEFDAAPMRFRCGSGEVRMPAPVGPFFWPLPVLAP